MNLQSRHITHLDGLLCLHDRWLTSDFSLQHRASAAVEFIAPQGYIHPQQRMILPITGLISNSFASHPAQLSLQRSSVSPPARLGP
jgi:hypothetical protein